MSNKIKPINFRPTKQLSSNLIFLKNLFVANPGIIQNEPTSQNALLNLLLTDYTNLLINVWKDGSKRTYSTIYSSFYQKKGEPELKKLVRHEQEMMDRINELMYLQLSINKVINLTDQDYLKDTKSFLDYGTPEYEIRTKLKRLVDQDNKKLFVSGRKNNGEHS